MKKIPVFAAVVAVTLCIVISGCTTSAPAPSPTPTPPPAAETWATDLDGVPLAPELEGLVDPSLVRINPYGEDFAVKPDGTPYRFGYFQCWSGDDWNVIAGGMFDSLIKRAGGSFYRVDAEMVLERQIEQVEDVVSLEKVDAILLQPVDERGLVPSVKMATDAGIPVFTMTLTIPSDFIVATSRHDYPGPTGIQMIGQVFAERAEEIYPEPLYIWEGWLVRSWVTAQERHDGLVAGCDLDNHPNITIVESPDNMMSAEDTASAVMDAFTAHPEYNAAAHQGGGQSGIVEGLAAIGRLQPIGHPDHVFMCCQDIDTRMIDGLLDDTIDYNGSSDAWQMMDALVKQVLWHVVIGEEVPVKFVNIPIVILSKDNLYTEKLFGGTACQPLMPIGDFDKWPVLNHSEIGLEIPTK